MSDKSRRPIDDFSRVLAIVICAMPVATYCAIHIMYYLIASAGGTAPDLAPIQVNFNPIVLMIVGGAIGMAFRYSPVGSDQTTQGKQAEPQAQAQELSK
jgi:hypothetical protein